MLFATYQLSATYVPSFVELYDFYLCLRKRMCVTMDVCHHGHHGMVSAGQLHSSSCATVVYHSLYPCFVPLIVPMLCATHCTTLSVSGTHSCTSGTTSDQGNQFGSKYLIGLSSSCFYLFLYWKSEVFVS